MTEEKDEEKKAESYFEWELRHHARHIYKEDAKKREIERRRRIKEAFGVSEEQFDSVLKKHGLL